ncbi:hypothetical protein EXIGLDRAFT_761952 [Exidia glandulosa HHB12029]|uniref:C2H2-type domain-containing protein n=1 Tax=Exidia glandulosa HHB12029 TaxID=1314781 RepID=A0A165N1U0_EXIGL|nr:hypothetical protein EXIGLDRAFT_761952 [Exidia glandulosa HHB12029]
MPPGSSSWRSLASGASSRVRDYLRNGPGPRLQITPANASGSTGQSSGSSRRTWEQWARQKLSRTRSVDDFGASGVEQVVLFPGWATRRYASQKAANNGDLAVSAYATSLRPPELATRSQKAFMCIARGFAALPKLPSLSFSSSTPPSPQLQQTRTQEEDMVDLSKLPPGSKHFDNTTSHLAVMTEEPEEDLGSSSSRSSSPEPPLPSEESCTTSLPLFAPEDIALLHANLNARLRPFWASVVANRLVRLRVYLHPQVENDEPLMTHDTLTGPQGAFSMQLRVPVRLHTPFLFMPAPVRRSTSPGPNEKPLPDLPPAQTIEAEIAIPLTRAPHTEYFPFVCAQCDKRFRHVSALNNHLKKHRHSQSRSGSNNSASTAKRRATAARQYTHESSSEAEEVSPPPPQYKKRRSTPKPEDDRRNKRRRLTNVDKHRGIVRTASAAGTILAEVKAGFERQAEKDVTEIFVQTYKKVAAAKLEKMRELIEKL